jgi:thymidine kinase
MSLLLITGPMKSGKSDRLISLRYRHSRTSFPSPPSSPPSVEGGEEEKKVIVFAPLIDERNLPSGRVCSRTGASMPAQYVDTLPDPSSFPPESAIFIDEAQFFGPALVDFCRTALDAGHSLHVSALNSTFTRDPWPCISQLMSLCTSIEFLRANCDLCYKEDAGVFTKRVGGSTSLIDTHCSYLAVCVRCYPL